MRTFIKICVALIIIAFSAALFAQSFWGGKTMSASEVKTKWGNEKYDAKKFREGDYEIKAKMSHSIMEDKSLIGKKITEIREIFGPPEGFYFNDTYPAYIIQDGKNQSEDTWQIVFRIGMRGKIRDVIMHRNCCER